MSRWDRELKAWFLARGVTACERCASRYLVTVAHALKRRFIQTAEHYRRAALLCQDCHHFVEYGNSEVPGGHERMAKMIDEVIDSRERGVDYYTSEGVLRERGRHITRSRRQQDRMEEMLRRQVELSAVPVGNIPDGAILTQLRGSIIEDPNVPPDQMIRIGGYNTGAGAALTGEMLEEMRSRTRVLMSPAQQASYQGVFGYRPYPEQLDLPRSYRDMFASGDFTGRPTTIIADDMDEGPTQAEAVFDGLMEGIKIETEEPKKPSRKMRLIKD